MLRMQLPEVWIACICTVARSARMSGTSSSFGQLYWTFWRVLRALHHPPERPVVLDVLAGGEVRVALVVLARDVREHPHLLRVQQAVGDADPQHRREALDVQAV